MRIRTIKPEFWMHEGLCKCSEFTRLLAIALLNWADDEGYFMANPILIRGQVFPFLDDSKIIPRSLQDLSREGWIELGKDDQGRMVGRVLNFGKHQRVDKPKPSEIKASSTFQDESKTHPRTVQDASKEEGKGREEEGNGIPPNPQGGMGDQKPASVDPQILPANWQRMSEKVRKRTKVFQNSETMKVMGAWFGRKPETLWTVAESVALTATNPPQKEIDGMGRYYSAQIADGDFRRHDLLTLLNNWTSELDRARKFITTQSA